MSTSITLPAPRRLTMPLEDALAGRRSRRYGGPLDTGTLATILYHVSTAPPTAGGLYTIHPVIAAGEVEGLDELVWSYAPAEHVLYLVDEAPQGLLSRAQAAMGADTPPPAVLALRARWEPLRGRYGEGAAALAPREAGCWLQSAYLAAHAAGAGGCALGPGAWGAEDLAAFALWG